MQRSRPRRTSEGLDLEAVAEDLIDDDGEFEGPDIALGIARLAALIAFASSNVVIVEAFSVARALAQRAGGRGHWPNPTAFDRLAPGERALLPDQGLKAA
jgi:hypothetical protein